MLKKLPVGMQTLSKIINGDFLYIDKTKLALDLIESNQFVFLSRPRRFGKSLFLDTLHQIFAGNKELFKGLYAYDKYNWEEKHPVIKISFSGDIRNKESLREILGYLMKDNQRSLGISCESATNPNETFKELIQKTYEKYNKQVVILIDEYDKPIVDNIENIPAALEVRDGICDFYTQIKNSDQYVRFAFLTGVSKFTKASVFSGLNNLNDISLDPKYATICGYTQNDIATTFLPYLEDVDFEKLKVWYNGYNFLGDKVYNPFDILLFIDKGKAYDNYWFSTGTPKFLIDLLKKKQYFLPNLEEICVGKEITDSFDIENLSLETIMFQSGYLTIKEVKSNELDELVYYLVFPNKEVRISFNNYLADLFVNSTTRVSLKNEIAKILFNGNLLELEANIKRLFASIAYNNFTNNYIADYEGFYASVIYAYFASLGLETIAEDITNKGRIDLTLKFGERVYIFEFKVLKGEEPLAQIKAKKYYEKYSGEIYLIGIVFDPEARNVAEFVWERA